MRSTSVSSRSESSFLESIFFKFTSLSISPIKTLYLYPTSDFPLSKKSLVFAKFIISYFKF